MLHLFLPTELHGSVPVLITRRHGVMFLRCKEGYFLFSVDNALKNSFYNIAWNKFTHKRETIIAHRVGNLLLTTVFTAVRWSYKEPFISLSTSTIQNFTLVWWTILEKTCSEGLVVAGTPDCASYIINVDMVRAY